MVDIQRHIWSYENKHPEDGLVLDTREDDETILDFFQRTANYDINLAGWCSPGNVEKYFDDALERSNDLPNYWSFAAFGIEPAVRDNEAYKEWREVDFRRTVRRLKDYWREFGKPAVGMVKSTLRLNVSMEDLGSMWRCGAEWEDGPAALVNMNSAISRKRT